MHYMLQQNTALQLVLGFVVFLPSFALPGLHSILRVTHVHHAHEQHLRSTASTCACRKITRSYNNSNTFHRRQEFCVVAIACARGELTA